MVTIKAKALEELVRDVFVKAGCSEAEGARIGKYLVSANLTGHDSHGVQRVPRYLQWMAEGEFVADRTVKVLSETPVLAVVDGQYGFGQTVAPQAVAIGIAKCQSMGLAAVALRNAGHIGRVGDWAEMAAAAGLISIHYVNAASSVLVAPYGGVDRRFSTAPYCVGVPRTGQTPLVLDFATSIVAEGKVLNASFGGKKIPADALIAPDGKTSGDPHVLYGDYTPTGPRTSRTGKGAIRAFGEHKGSGLALMCEILGGSLTGSGAAQEGRRWANGMLSIYLDPARIDPEGFFPEDVRRYVDYVKSARPATPGGEVLVPGEPEERMRAERLKNGVPLPDDTWAAIMEAARKVGLDEGRLKRAVD
ncbi:MAG TPA: malate/lactate/ureidoglycolate dehydrogenase [Hyphomicrobiaceae bacterium]|nr:malate/lactate/ureidoglycolate dehydrogenase [Hyphomicrobiaceae bacterium]